MRIRGLEPVDPHFFCLELVLPHHALHGLDGAGIVLGAGLGIVVILDLAVHLKVDELPNGHACVHPHGVGAGDFQGPGIAEADVTLARRGVNVDAQAANAAFAFQEGDGSVGFGVLQGYAQVQGVGMQDDTFFRDFEVLNGVVLAGVQDVVLVKSQPLAQVHIVGVGAQTVAVEGLDDDLALVDGFHYFNVAQNHNSSSFGGPR